MAFNAFLWLFNINHLLLNIIHLTTFYDFLIHTICMEKRLPDYLKREVGYGTAIHGI